MTTTPLTRLAPSSVHVRRLQVGGRSLVAKSAVGRARQQLRHEAELLEHLAAPYVVPLVALRDTDDRTDLVTADAGPHDLSGSWGADPDDLLAALHAAAVAVARLHARGWSHGALCGEHVVIGDHGVAFCSLGSARPLEADPAALGHDQRQLVELVQRHLDHVDPSWSREQRRRWRRVARSVGRAITATRDARMDHPREAALLAATLGEVRRASARPSRRAARPAGETRILSSPSIRLVAGMVGLAAFTAWWGALSGAEMSSPAASVNPTTTRSATIDAGAGDLGAADPGATDPGAAAADPGFSVRGNLLTVAGTTYRAGAEGDVLAFAPWSCDGAPGVVLLRPSTGEVFVFDEHPTATHPVAATHVTTAVGATDLAVSEESDCPRVVVLTADGTAQAINAAEADPTSTQEAPP